MGRPKACDPCCAPEPDVEVGLIFCPPKRGCQINGIQSFSSCGEQDEIMGIYTPSTTLISPFDGPPDNPDKSEWTQSPIQGGLFDCSFGASAFSTSYPGGGGGHGRAYTRFGNPSGLFETYYDFVARQVGFAPKRIYSRGQVTWQFKIGVGPSCLPTMGRIWPTHQSQPGPFISPPFTGGTDIVVDFQACIGWNNFDGEELAARQAMIGWGDVWCRTTQLKLDKDATSNENFCVVGTKPSRVVDEGFERITIELTDIFRNNVVNESNLYFGAKIIPRFAPWTQTIPGWIACGPTLWIGEQRFGWNQAASVHFESFGYNIVK